MLAMLVTYIMVGTQPVEFVIEERMPMDICEEVVADYIEHNAAAVIVPREGELKGQDVLIHPRNLICIPYYEA